MLGESSALPGRSWAAHLTRPKSPWRGPPRLTSDTEAPISLGPQGKGQLLSETGVSFEHLFPDKGSLRAPALESSRPALTSQAATSVGLSQRLNVPKGKEQMPSHTCVQQRPDLLLFLSVLDEILCQRLVLRFDAGVGFPQVLQVVDLALGTLDPQGEVMHRALVLTRVALTLAQQRGYVFRELLEFLDVRPRGLGAFLQSLLQSENKTPKYC